MNINPSVIRVLAILITLDKRPANAQLVKMSAATPPNKGGECTKVKRYFKDQKDFRIAKALSLAG